MATDKGDSGLTGREQAIHLEQAVHKFQVGFETEVEITSQHPKDINDPLNWPQWVKWLILCQVALAALQTPLNSSITIPTFEPLAEKWGIPISRVAYLIAIGVVPNAVGPLFIIPFTDIFGRRPIYLIGFTITLVTSIAGAYTETWSQQAVTRAINSFGTGTAVSVGAATITDIFYQHEIGKAVGIWTLLTNTGAFWGLLVGCFVVSDGGWTWAFKAAAVLNGMTLLLMIFCMPETIHPRGGNRLPYSTNFDWYDRFVRIRRRRQDRLDLWTILRPLQMSLYPSVFFPSLLTAITNALGCLGIALIVPSFFAKIYGFDLKASGETNIAFIIGGFLGEIFAGKWSDYLIIRLARNRGGEHIPELRLHALWPAVILIPGGLLVFGICLHFESAWIGPILGGAITIFGYQIVVTVTTAYSIDCYRSQSGYVGAWFNCIRQSLAIATPFFDFTFAEQVGYAWEFAIYAIVISFCFVPVLLLLLLGSKMRHKLGNPKFDRDL